MHSMQGLGGNDRCFHTTWATYGSGALQEDALSRFVGISRGLDTNYSGSMVSR